MIPPQKPVKINPILPPKKMPQKHFFTSESVTEGHPDKVADQISDAILDAVLEQDPDGRVACETLVNTGLVLISGEMRTECYIDLAKVARQKIRDIGYNDPELGFDADSCAVLTAIDEQSPEIAAGVDAGKTPQGAGDQGLMFGFGVDETPEFMPVAISTAHELARELANLRRQKILPYLRPDGKVQVTFQYEDSRPVRIDTIVCSTQHASEVSQQQIRADLQQPLFEKICGDWIDEKTKYFINPTGKFVIGGPKGDCGLTGRKIIVDTYGGAARHGGGCFSGKDPSKVDRSAAYLARHIAKNMVANGLARKCEVQLSYAIGVAEPVSVWVETFGTSQKSPSQLAEIVRKNFPLTPAELIDYLDLKKPIYCQTAKYGHFGRKDLDLTWEKVVKLKV